MTDQHEHDAGELDAGIAAMLRREGGRVDVPADAAARVMDRVAASIGGFGGGGGGGGGSGTGTGTGTGTGMSAVVAKVAPFLITFVVGAGVGGVVVDAVKSAPVVVAPAPSAVVTAPVVPVVVAPSASMVSVSVDALPSASAAPAARVVAADAGEDSFVAERKLLDVARTALARGDHAAAMQALGEHGKTYAGGRLVEEREALLVRTLAESGRTDEARATAARFKARWPRSVLLPAVEAAVDSP